MVRVLFNTDDHHAHGARPAVSGGGPAPLVDDSSVLGSHRCRVYDMSALLQEPRWLGTRSLQLELTTSTMDEMTDFCTRLRAALRGVVTARIRVLSPCQLRLTRIDIRSISVDASLLLPLADQILSVDVEKEPNWRAGALPGHAASAASAATAASSSAVPTPSSLSPFDPASVTDPSNPAGAALCCTVLHTRMDYISVLSAEINAAARAQKTLLQVLKSAGGSATTGSGSGSASAQAELEAASSDDPATASAADDADESSSSPLDLPADVKRTCLSLAARVRAQFARLEAHRQRLTQLLKTDLPLVSAMHICNVCQRVLRVEAAGAAPPPSQPAKHAAGGAPQTQSGTVSEADLQRMYSELALSARAGGVVDSTAAAQAAAAAAAAAAVAAAYSNAATGAASSAQFAVPLTPAESSSAPLLTAAQARARLTELQGKLSAASGAEAKARRKKIARKIADLRAKYAVELHGFGAGNGGDTSGRTAEDDGEPI